MEPLGIQGADVPDERFVQDPRFFDQGNQQKKKTGQTPWFHLRTPDFFAILYGYGSSVGFYFITPAAIAEEVS
jgi:hypothetical protein